MSAVRLVAGEGPVVARGGPRGASDDGARPTGSPPSPMPYGAEERARAEAVVARVVAATVVVTGVSAGEIYGRSTTKEIAAARHVAMAVARRAGSLSLPKLGLVFQRDHTTVQHGVKRADPLNVAAVFRHLANGLPEVSPAPAGPPVGDMIRAWLDGISADARSRLSAHDVDALLAIGAA